MSQLSMFGANATPVNKRQAPDPRLAVPPPSSAAQPAALAGLGFGELFFIPRRQLEMGIRVVRWDDCRRCGRETSHVFTLIGFMPRTWARACLECRCTR